MARFDFRKKRGLDFYKPSSQGGYGGEFGSNYPYAGGTEGRRKNRERFFKEWQRKRTESFQRLGGVETAQREVRDPTTGELTSIRSEKPVSEFTTDAYGQGMSVAPELQREGGMSVAEEYKKKGFWQQVSEKALGAFSKVGGKGRFGQALRFLTPQSEAELGTELALAAIPGGKAVKGGKDLTEAAARKLYGVSKGLFKKAGDPSLKIAVTEPGKSSKFLGLGGVVVDESGNAVFKTGKFYPTTPKTTAAAGTTNVYNIGVNAKQSSLMYKIFEGAKLTLGGALLATGILTAAMVGRQQGSESPESISFYTNQVLKSDDPEIVQDFQDAYNEIQELMQRDPEGLEMIPFIGEGFYGVSNKLISQTEIAPRVINQLLDDKKESLLTGKTDQQITNDNYEAYLLLEDELERARQAEWEEAEAERFLRDQLEFDRQNMEILARQDADYQRQIDLANYYHELAMARLAEEERQQKELQEFWLEYLKEKAKIVGHGGSNLFGGGLF